MTFGGRKSGRTQATGEARFTIDKGDNMCYAGCHLAVAENVAGAEALIPRDSKMKLINIDQ